MGYGVRKQSSQGLQGEELARSIEAIFQEEKKDSGLAVACSLHRQQQHTRDHLHQKQFVHHCG